MDIQKEPMSAYFERAEAIQLILKLSRGKLQAKDIYEDRSSGTVRRRLKEMIKMEWVKKTVNPEPLEVYYELTPRGHTIALMFETLEDTLINLSEERP